MTEDLLRAIAADVRAHDAQLPARHPQQRHPGASRSGDQAGLRRPGGALLQALGRDQSDDAARGGEQGKSYAAATVLGIEGRSLHAIFGSPDDMKFCSSMTLFSLAADEGDSVFQHALDRYCAGRRDERTLALVQGRR